MISLLQGDWPMASSEQRPMLGVQDLSASFSVPAFSIDKPCQSGKPVRRKRFLCSSFIRLHCEVKSGEPREDRALGPIADDNLDG